MLPTLDQVALYRAYHRDKPWNDPANDEFAKTKMPVFICPGNPTPQDVHGRYYSSYALLTGPGTAFDQDEPRKLEELPNGSSQTILLVEACGANIVWNEPRDIDVGRDPVGINLPGKTPGTSTGWLSSYHRNTVNIAFADGSVKALSINTDPKVLRALMTVDADDNPPEMRLP